MTYYAIYIRNPENGKEVYTGFAPKTNKTAQKYKRAVERELKKWATASPEVSKFKARIKKV